MRRLTVGIGALIIGWWLAHAPPSWALPQETDNIVGVLIDLAGNLALGRLLRPANDVLDENNNTWVGFQSQIECTASQGFKSTVSGGVGPCFPDRVYPPFGVGLQMEPNMGAFQCAFRSAISSRAIQNTDVVSLQSVNPQSGVSLGPGSNAGGMTLGGLCFPTSSARYSFAGYLGGEYFLGLNGILNQTATSCAFLVNICDKCSCGPYSHNN